MDVAHIWQTSEMRIENWREKNYNVNATKWIKSNQHILWVFGWMTSSESGDTNLFYLVSLGVKSSESGDRNHVSPRCIGSTWFWIQRTWSHCRGRRTGWWWGCTQDHPKHCPETMIAISIILIQDLDKTKPESKQVGLIVNISKKENKWHLLSILSIKCASKLTTYLQ